jgi:TRAP transporter TAXI family solute receptor
MMPMRFARWCALLAVSVVGLSSAFVAAQDAKRLRIATGPENGTYNELGSIIAASAASGPVAISATPTKGSVANVAAIAAGQVESGLVQADIAYWALSGTGAFEGKPKLENLQAIANLYQESIHLVVRRRAGIQSVADLRDKRISLDEQGSGTLLEARLILDAWGLKESELKAEYVGLEAAAQRLKDGSLDGFFYVGGFPVPAIAALANSGTEIDLVAIEGPKADKLRGDHKFMARDEIPGDTYKGLPAARTLSVGALWISSTRAQADVVYEATKLLWSDRVLQQLAGAHPKGQMIRKESALTGISVPLHAGAERYYREAGMLQK